MYKYVGLVKGNLVVDIIRCLYRDIEGVANLVDKRGLDRNDNFFVKIFTSELSRKQAVELAKDVKRLLPNCEIFGSSSSNMIFKGDIIENATMIIIERYNHQTIKKEIIPWENKEASQLAKDVVAKYEGCLQQFLHILISDNYYDAHDFVEYMNIYAPDAKLVGGMSSGIDEDSGYVFTEAGIHDKSIMMYTLIGYKLNCFASCNNIDDPISSVYEITKMNGSYIEEIENQEALYWFLDFLKLNETKNTYKKEVFLHHFMMLLPDYNNASRYLKYVPESNKLSLYYSRLREGTRFRIGYVNPIQVRENAFKFYNSMSERYIESLFVYICSSRRLFLQQMMDIELSPLKTADVCGLFLAGEICHDGKENQLFNGTMITTEIAEEKRKVDIDMDAFNYSARIDIDNSIVDFVMEEKRNEIQKQIKIINTRTYKSLDTGLPNILQFREDCEKYNYSKSATMYIENADIIIGFNGYENYIKFVNDALKEMYHYFKVEHDITPSAYMLNYCTFLVTTKINVSDDEFKRILKDGFDNFRITTLKRSEVSLVVKFVIVFSEEKLLDKSIFAMQKAKKLNLPYFVYQEESTVDEKRELTVVALLKKVIETKDVVPYYQGIYDNFQKKITKYEALMRVVGEDGMVYAPGVFMNIAIRYHLYPELSRIMISKALADFEYREEILNINISPIDMFSDDFCEWFWQTIDNYSHPEKLTLEIVESAHMHDEWDRVKAFVDRAYSYNIEIAIDDFGKDYSNLMRVLKVNPKHIKIDGSIVKQVATNADSQIILKTVKFLCNHVRAEAVAEFVENEEIQAMVEEVGIRYSQGYYFSKPKPIALLKSSFLL